MAGKMVVFCGSDAPEKAFPPFMLGLGAKAADMDVMLFFTMSGLNIIKKGSAEKIELQNAPMILPEFIKNGIDSGIKFVACSAAFGIAGITQEDLIDGVTIGGVATFINEAKDADIVVSF
jgi:predicted peroxiredoxin